MDLDEMPEVLRRGVAAYVRGMWDKIAFLEILRRMGRKDEALTLCCIYVEGLAQRIYESERRGRSKHLFVKVLLDHGAEELLSLVDPEALAGSLDGVKCSGEDTRQLAHSMRSIASQRPREVHTIADLLDLAQDLPGDQLARLEENIWRGTVAASVYSQLRSPLAHGQHGAPAGLVGIDTKFKGKPVPRVSFDTIYPALRRIAKFWEVQLVTTPWPHRETTPPA